MSKSKMQEAKLCSKLSKHYEDEHRERCHKAPRLAEPPRLTHADKGRNICKPTSKVDINAATWATLSQPKIDEAQHSTMEYPLIDKNGAYDKHLYRQVMKTTCNRLHSVSQCREKAWDKFGRLGSSTGELRRRPKMPCANEMAVNPYFRQQYLVGSQPRGAGNRTQSQNASRKASTSRRTSNDLTDQQLKAFREVFRLFDHDESQKIDTEELKMTLDSVGIHLGEEQILKIIKATDRTGDTQINFEDFLQLMTNTDIFLEALATGNDNKDGAILHAPEEGKDIRIVLFNALSEFMKKSYLEQSADIAKYYSKKYHRLCATRKIAQQKGPHVVSHFADCARITGLSTKELAQRIADAQNDLLSEFTVGQEQYSPYAQPLTMNSPFKGPMRPKGGRKNSWQPAWKRGRNIMTEGFSTPGTPGTPSTTADQDRPKTAHHSRRKSRDPVKEDVLVAFEEQDAAAKKKEEGAAQEEGEDFRPCSEHRVTRYEFDPPPPDDDEDGATSLTPLHPSNSRPSSALPAIELEKIRKNNQPFQRRVSIGENKRLMIEREKVAMRQARPPYVQIVHDYLHPTTDPPHPRGPPPNMPTSLRMDSGGTGSGSKGRTDSNDSKVVDLTSVWLNGERRHLGLDGLGVPKRFRRLSLDKIRSLREKVDAAKLIFEEHTAKAKKKNTEQHYMQIRTIGPLPPKFNERFQWLFSAYSSAEANNRSKVSVKRLKHIILDPKPPWVPRFIR